MFNRIKIKTESKILLKNVYDIAVLISIINSIISTSLLLISQSLSENSFVRMIFSIFWILISTVTGFAVTYFSMNIAKNKDVSFKTFLDGLSLYKTAILSELWKTLFLFLWYLILFLPLIATLLIFLHNFDYTQIFSSPYNILNFSTVISEYTETNKIFFYAFIISFSLPIFFGIFKILQYLFTPYILIDEKNISIPDALKKSIELSKGNKINILILFLSFIGWFILIGIFTSVVIEKFISNKLIVTFFQEILLSFLIPYINVSLCRAYLSIKDDFINNESNHTSTIN